MRTILIAATLLCSLGAVAQSTTTNATTAVSTQNTDPRSLAKKDFDMLSKVITVSNERDAANLLKTLETKYILRELKEQNPDDYANYLIEIPNLIKTYTGEANYKILSSNKSLFKQLTK